jgi:glycine cleavage system H protein
MSAPTEVKADRKYTKEHEWALVQDGQVLVGITAFAVDQLGDITLVNLDVKVGDRIEAHKAFGTIESVKTLSDLYAPIAGTIVRVNPELESRPELINEDPWERGWMIAIAPASDGETSSLLDPAAYSAHLESSAH